MKEYELDYGDSFYKYNIEGKASIVNELNLSLSGNILTWNTIENVAEYQLYVYNTLSYTTNESIDLKKLIPSQKGYNLRIKAILKNSEFCLSNIINYVLSLPILQTKTITPSEEYQIITPDEDSILEKVIVERIPANYAMVDGTLEITENGEVDVSTYATANVEVNTFPTYIATKSNRNNFSSLFSDSSINDTQLNTLMHGLDTSNVTNMSGMFHYCYNLTTIPPLDTSNVTNMNSMFDMYPIIFDYPNLTSIPQLNTSNVTDMGYMFRNCRSLTSIPLLDTSNVTDMGGMFYGCTNLTTIPQLDTTNVTNMNEMFYECRSLTTIPLLNTTNVTDMTLMFSHCRSLTSIPLLDTSNVTNMYLMFENCNSLTSIQLLNVSNVTNMNSVFGGCTNLTSLNMDFTENINTPIQTSAMFDGCTNLKSLIMTNMKVSFDISASTQFETQDLVNLIDSLYDFMASGVSTYALGGYATLTMGSTNLAKLSNEQIRVAKFKGWALE